MDNIDNTDNIIDVLKSNSDFKEQMELVFKWKGVIFGGFLRDIIAEIDPSDIDAVVPLSYKDKFEHDLEKHGYEKEPPSSIYDTTIFRKKNKINIEVIYDENEPGSVVLGPATEPDFDVNILTFDGSNLYNWINMFDPDLDEKRIVENIQKRKTYQFPDADRHRIDKMKLKGFEIVGLFKHS